MSRYTTLSRFGLDIRDDDIRAVTRECEGDLSPVPACCARYNRRFACQ